VYVLQGLVKSAKMWTIPQPDRSNLILDVLAPTAATWTWSWDRNN